MRLASIAMLALLVVLMIAACEIGGGGSDAADAEEALLLEQAEEEAVAAGTASFTMEGHVSWLIGVLDAGEFDPVEATERLHPSFLAEVPITALNAPLGQIAPASSAPWHVVEERRDGGVTEITLESATGTQLTMTVALASGEPNQIEGLLLQPKVTDAPPGYTTAQLDADMASFAQEGAVGIYEVTSSSCEVIHELNGDRPLAIGSVFKLWVLSELANQIAQGAAAWDEPLEVRADLRSNPSGQVYHLADGDTLTLREYAEAMISTSDNTATDHLIERLGRASIEAAMARAGVTQPALNRPFMATRELFWLKYLADPPNPADWYETDENGRRALLDSLEGRTAPWVLDPALTTADNAEGLPRDQPRNLDIEFFASPHDLCRTLVHLDALASMPGLEPVADILSINPGMDFDTFAAWTHVRFKGGSEPGVFALAWWLDRGDGRRFVVAGILNDPEVNFSQLAATDLISHAIGLI